MKSVSVTVLSFVSEQNFNKSSMPNIFENAIQAAGHGMYHKFVIGLSCLCFFSQATAYMSLPLNLPLSACDMDLSYEGIAWINAIFSLGAGIGGYIFGALTDTNGRKCMISTSLVIVFCSCLAAGFSYGGFMLCVCAFTLGAGVAANEASVRINMAEILGQKRRGFYLAMLDVFWSLGFLLVITLAWAVAPSILNHKHNELRLTTWRLMFALSGLSCIVIACGSALLEASPRLYLANGDPATALDTLRHMYAVNNSKHAYTYPVRMQEIIGSISQHVFELPFDAAFCYEYQCRTIYQIIKRTLFLFNKKYIKIFLLMLMIKIFLAEGLWTNTVFMSKNIQWYKNDSVLRSVNLSHIDIGKVSPCLKQLAPNAHRDLFLISLAVVTSSILVMYLVDILGRRLIFSICCSACVISTIGLLFLKNIIVRAVLSFLYVMAYRAIEICFNILLVESFPTFLRGTSNGGTQLISRLLTAAMKFFLILSVRRYYIALTGSLLACAVLGYFLPETKQKPMSE